MPPEVNMSHHRAWQERRRRASPSIQQISGCSLIWCFDDCRLTVQSQIPSRCSVVFWWIQRPEHMIHHVHTQWAWPASVSSQGKGDHQERLCIDLQWPPKTASTSSPTTTRQSRLMFCFSTRLFRFLLLIFHPAVFSGRETGEGFWFKNTYSTYLWTPTRDNN